MELKLRKLSVSNFKSLNAEVNIEDDVTMFVGRNGTGKSTALDCLVLLSEVAGGSDVPAALQARGGFSEVVAFKDTTQLQPLAITVDVEALGLSPDNSGSALLSLFRLQDSALPESASASMQTIRYAMEIGIHSPEGGADLLGETIIWLDNAEPVELMTGRWQGGTYHVRRTNHIGDDPSTWEDIGGGAPAGAILSHYSGLHTNTGSFLPAFRDFLSKLRKIDSTRLSPPSGSLAHQPALARDGSNLLQIVGRALLAGKHDQLLATARSLIPRIINITTPNVAQQNLVLTVTERTGRGELEVGWANINDGSKQAIILSTFLREAPLGTVLLVEEPENGLHPDAQNKLLREIQSIAKQDGKQVIICTHSPLLVDGIPLAKLRLFYRDDAGISHCRELSHFSSVGSWLEKEGLLKSWLLLAGQRRLQRFDCVLIVDGEDDKAVWEELISRFSEGLKDKVTVIHGEGEAGGMRFAQLLQLVNEFGVNSMPFLLVQDSDGDPTHKEAATLAKDLKPDNLHVLSEKEIDSYLCNTRAIARAFNRKDNEIASILATSGKGKAPLERVCSRFAPAGRKDPATKAAIARFLEREDVPELIEVLEKVSARLARG